MKLILASAGIDTPGVIEKAVEFVGKPASEISVAIIFEAHVTRDRNMRWQIGQMQKIADTFGGHIRVVNLLALDIHEIETRLLASDIVFCFGGGTHWLKTVFDKSSLTKILPKILESCVWIGNSAGTEILCKRNPYSEKISSHPEPTLGIDEFCRIVDLNICVHIGNRDNDSRYTLDTCIQESKESDTLVYALSDSSALVVDGEETYMIGKDCYKIKNGKIIEQQ